MAAYYEKQLQGKYQVTMDLPQTLKELLWRVAYFRRNESSWRLLTKSFKPSTTNMEVDAGIKSNTIKALNELMAFYESASTIDPILLKSVEDPKFVLKKTPYWPSVDTPVSNGSSIKHPVYDHSMSSSQGLPTVLDDAVIKQGAVIKTGLPLSASDALRVQAKDPFTNYAAENIVQDIDKMVESAKMVFNSYGLPYTTVRGEDCSRWLFNSRNMAMKAVALVVQECPWLIQAINKFAFFNEYIISQIASIKPSGDYTHLYGHLESADDTLEDSPRHLLTPLWSINANIADVPLSQLQTKGRFEIVYYNTNGTAGTAQNLLNIYSNDTYEPNAFDTNNPITA